MKNIKHKILVIDDTEYNAVLISAILRNAGYEVKKALSVEECLKDLYTELPDLILLDIMMPGVNGFDFCTQIKNDDRTKEIPVIFVSALSDIEVRVKGLTLGAVDYITKPYDDAEVLARVGIHLKIRDLEKERNEHIKVLSELNVEKSNLLQIMSHDLKSPMTSIMLISEYLMNNENVPAEKLNQYVKTIHSSTQKLILLINKLVDISRLENKKIDLEITKFDLCKTISDCILLVHQHADRKNIMLVNECAGSHINPSLDESKINQILNNLIYNSIKFTNPGGVIRIKCSASKDDRNEILEISVKDNGVGMTEEVLNNLFKKYGVQQRPGTQGEEGTGLGLSIVKQYVDMMQGEIKVISEENKGTEFILTFYNCLA